jgi:hypothetical protein
VKLEEPALETAPIHRSSCTVVDERQTDKLPPTEELINVDFTLVSLEFFSNFANRRQKRSSTGSRGAFLVVYLCRLQEALLRHRNVLNGVWCRGGSGRGQQFVQRSSDLIMLGPMQEVFDCSVGLLK